MYKGGMQKPSGAECPMHLVLSNVKPRFQNFVKAKKIFLFQGILFLFMLTFARFSWVAAILPGSVFKRFGFAREKG